MQVRATDEDFATLRYDSRVVAARADTASRLTILELPIDRTWQESVALRAYSYLTILVLAKGPDEGLFVDDLLGDDPYIVFATFFVFHIDATGSHAASHAAVPTWGLSSSWIAANALIIRVGHRQADMLHMAHLLRLRLRPIRLPCHLSPRIRHPTVRIWLSEPRSWLLRGVAARGHDFGSIR